MKRNHVNDDECFTCVIKNGLTRVKKDDTIKTRKKQSVIALSMLKWKMGVCSFKYNGNCITTTCEKMEIGGDWQMRMKKTRL